MTTRISGLSGSGLDIDAIVKESMKPYQLKFDTAKQQRDVVKYQQEQYRKIISDSRAFYSKYLDVAKTDSMMKSSNYGVVKFTSSDTTGPVSATGLPGASVDSYTVEVKQIAEKASNTLTDGAAGTGGEKSIVIGTGDTAVTIKFAADASDGNKTAAAYNAEVTTMKQKLNDSLQSSTLTVGDKALIMGKLSNLDKVTAKYSSFSKGVVFSATSMGVGGYNADATNTPKASFTLNSLAADEVTVTSSIDVKDTQAIAKITNSKGQSIDYVGNSNTTTIDGVQFTFSGKTTSDATLVGKLDTSDLKNKIVSFVNDYNTLLQSINTKIYEKRDKSYMPLTDDQKASMTDDQIKKWETKAQTGLLRKDSYLESLTSSMKSAMRTMSDSGLDLEEMGITPVKDYTDKNGMFTIDEDKLTKALEANPEKVKDLFLKASTSDKANDGGILSKLYNAFQASTQSTTSAIVLKAGVEGGVTDITSLLSKDLAKRQTAINEMEDQLTDRENALYSKYSKLETALSQLKSQQSSLSSYFSSGS
ncbi:MAG: flagellar filament capping protein FliD [Clostridium beijerinckii]|jgi:flagellar hook-associated protein 2|uniref:flagellar filament capping protein FliD n=1 Tax=Clostridium beijerinckii TaxID=1520 RepID=UPI0014949575|nr:flagellar filament capping protein FliD [Clostridium beijerinckii]MCI1477734.1 flagellar filament capping protein FliD [Clostridium beijerinckii]MCI1577950.1 flagellar filament capping protein FliD [Clostridium beijerinckii]MCI1583131.1 flagellar filament capping protein FliD [Clostridium beijerinckii]MCI1620639.1 flagellar filament capping protein FliD [Clostridium beijerinckii]NOW87876.1 flagellar hook-associated protein 2 [Clostridium beijerinckii]